MAEAARRPGRIEEALTRLLVKNATISVRTFDIESCVLSGKATSIQRLNRSLRNLGLAERRNPRRPYWAPGKRGLD